jgi:threonylcarbamoyladenosine tRNA methylthiotransferase MtaB
LQNADWDADTDADREEEAEDDPPAPAVPLPLAATSDFGLRTSDSAFPAIHRFDGHRRAFLKVQDGCDCFCSFCIIPFLRGGVRSKPVGAVVAEAAALLESGHRELVLTGVHLGAFGRPHGVRAKRWAGPGASKADVRMMNEESEAAHSSLGTLPSDFGSDAWSLNRSNRLAELVEALVRLPGPGGRRWRMRLSSLEATEVTARLVGAMAASGGKVCPHLHLPLQSGSSAVLHRMNRRYSAEDFVRVVEEVRRSVPDCSISTDVIVGFPGETEADFAETLAVAERCRFSKVHVFPYSARRGTAAAGYGGRVDPDEKRDRCRRLAEAGRRSASRYHSAWVGRTAEGLLELGGPLPDSEAAWAPPGRRVRRGLTERYGEVDVALPADRDPGGELFPVRLLAWDPDAGRFRGESAEGER